MEGRNIPGVSFAFAFAMNMLSTHTAHNSRPQLQNYTTSKKSSFAFAFVVQLDKYPRYQDFYVFACAILFEIITF